MGVAETASNAQVVNTGEFLRGRLPFTSEAMGRNMTDLSGIDPTQDASARLIAAVVHGSGCGVWVSSKG